MEPRRFDRLAKSFASRFSRRSVVQAAGAGLAAGLAGSRTVAQNATPTTDASDNPDKSFFLFVQTATSGSFTLNPDAGTPTVDGTPVAGGGADYLLTLDGHPGGTIYFSDRPDRIFGEAPTQTFLDGLGFPPENPPNAALVTQADDGTEDVVVLELLTPTFDEATGTVTYGATILDAYAGEGLAHVAARQQAATLPETFGRASLFIDDCADITGCYLSGGEADPFFYLGPIPGGPFGSCWSWNDLVCKPCSETQADLTRYCEDNYSRCTPGDCSAA